MVCITYSFDAPHCFGKCSTTIYVVRFNNNLQEIYTHDHHDHHDHHHHHRHHRHHRHHHHHHNLTFSNTSMHRKNVLR